MSIRTLEVRISKVHTMSILRVKCFIFAAIVVLYMLNICSKRYLNATIVGQVIHIFVSSAEKQGFFSA